MTTKKFIVKDTLVCDVTFLYAVECEPDDDGEYDPVGVYMDTQSKCIGHEVVAYHEAFDGESLDWEEVETIPLSDRQVQDMIAALATGLRDLYMGYPVKELHEHPRDLLARVITYFAERDELDDDMRQQWNVN